MLRRFLRDEVDAHGGRRQQLTHWKISQDEEGNRGVQSHAGEPELGSVLEVSWGRSASVCSVRSRRTSWRLSLSTSTCFLPSRSREGST
eukprot:347588-Hanusia_phi.AAC.1